jgi:hypothetical protein
VSSPRSRSWPSSAIPAALAPHARRFATPVWTSPSISPTSAAPPDTSPDKDRPRCAGRSTKPPQAVRRPGSPDRDYYNQAAERLGGNRACLALARKLLKRSYHLLRDLGDEALQPA